MRDQIYRGETFNYIIISLSYHNERRHIVRMDLSQGLNRLGTYYWELKRFGLKITMYNTYPH